MPSWPSRLLHASQPSNAPRTPELGPDRSIKNDIDVDTPGSASSPYGLSTRWSPNQSPRHGRSLSHPLTSIFGHGKKAETPTRDETSAFNLDARNGASPILRSDVRASGYPDPPKPKALDMEVGKCATCDSTIKWPKHLSIFRCTICLMINDLRPLDDSKFREGMDEQAGEKLRKSSYSGYVLQLTKNHKLLYCL